MTPANALAMMPRLGLLEPVDDGAHASELELINMALRRSLLEKERMQAILLSTLQSLTSGVLAVGQDGVVIVANPAACDLLEQPLENLATHQVEEVLAPVPERDALLLTLQGAGGGQRMVAWHRAVHAGPWIELTAVRALPPYDQYLAGLVLIEDRSEHRELEHQAALRNRLTGMGEIAINMAHEIRNPLGSIALFATALARELEVDDSLGPLASQIVQGVKTLEHLVANTLEFARPRRLSLAPVNLSDVLRDTLVFIGHPLQQKNISVLCNADLAPAATVRGDAEQLRQVFLNLTINAIQAMDEGGTLTMELGASPRGEWQVSVGDTGGGIPPTMLERIFDPFFTTRDKGSGIGLAVVHRIVTAHGGRVEVESEMGSGSLFRVLFPSAE